MGTRRYRFTILVLLICGCLVACDVGPGQAIPTLTHTPNIINTLVHVASITPTLKATLTLQPTASMTPTFSSPSRTPSPSMTPFLTDPISPSINCSIGLGLREETAQIILSNKDKARFVMAGSSYMSELYFPELGGLIRILGAPSLETLQRKAERAETNGLSYEALAFGLETSISTPKDEWQNMVESTHMAMDLADQYSKLLVMAPGLRLMYQNEEKYPPMSVLSDIWILQTQRIQRYPPGPEYREEVGRIVSQIRESNPDILILAQITLPPDREPDADEWISYRESIVDIVDGTYIGVYTWESGDTDKLVKTIETILDTVCGSDL